MEAYDSSAINSHKRATPSDALIVEGEPPTKLPCINNDTTSPTATADGTEETFIRFSTRDRKRTEFFTPEVFSNDDSIQGSKPRKKSRSKIISNSGVCRALHFEQQGLVPLTVTEEPDGHQEVANVELQPIDSVDRSEVPFMDAATDSLGKAEVPFMDITRVDDITMHTMLNETSILSLARMFPIGSLVWGKLPGYDWWPGCVISYDKKQMEKFKEEMETDEEDRMSSTSSMPDQEDEGDDMVWVKWYGDNQLSLLACRKLRSFALFTEFFSPSKLKGLYKKAVFAILREAAKRCHIDSLFRNEDKQLIWKFHTITYHQLYKKTVTFADSTNGGTGVELSEDTAATNGSNDIFTPLTSNPSRLSLDSGNKKKSSKERGVVQLTGTEKEVLEWAIKRFLPSGPDGFKPKPGHSMDVTILPLDPKSEQDTTYTPRGVQKGGAKKDGINDVDRYGKSKRGVQRGGAEVVKSKLKLLVEVRNKAQFELVTQGKLDIEEVCLGCGSSAIVTKHPLFHGGLCINCRDMFMQCVYLFDDDGTQMYCTICSAGNEVFICDTQSCSKVYCGVCIEKLCGKDELEAVKEADKWQCYMCCNETRGAVGLMKLRENWDVELHELFINDEMAFDPPKFYPPVCAEDRKPIRVLGLFDGIGTGLLVLKELGIEVDLYVSSEIDPDAIKVSRVNHVEMRHVGAVECITEKEVKAWGPFDLVMGGSPCNDLSIVNPARKGIYDGTGKLFFEFYRILNFAMPHPDDPRPFFWMFENVVSMKASDKMTISRFLQCNPVVVDALNISAAHRARFFWGNLPGMNRPTAPLPSDRLTLQSCLEPNCFRTAQFNKLRTVTTKMNSIKQTKKGLLPVKMESELGNEDGDVLWCTEMERLFGFPVHYTDVGNLGRCGRQRLLGKAWSVPVARHLLSPLKEYFKSRTTGIPSSVKCSSLAANDEGGSLSTDQAHIHSKTADSTAANIVALTPPPSNVDPVEPQQIDNTTPFIVQVSENSCPAIDQLQISSCQ